jgi:hypothetical protein
VSKLKHVRRQSLPWRPDEDHTECGRPIGGLATVSRAQWRETAREWTALCGSWQATRPRGSTDVGPPGVPRPNICGTCWDTCVRHPEWERDPAAALHRELDRLPHRGPERDGSCLDLLALAALYREHSGRFAEYRAAIEDQMRHRATGGGWSMRAGRPG